MSSVEISADRPMKQLVSGLGRDLSLLIRQEIELAKAEVTEKATRAAKGAAKIGAGAFIAYVGVFGLGAALILLAIAIGVVAWLAAAIVAFLFIVAGYAIIQKGRNTLKERRTEGTLRRTKQTTHEIAQWAKEQLT
jgi:fatty acid desaturase